MKTMSIILIAGVMAEVAFAQRYSTAAVNSTINGLNSSALYSYMTTRMTSGFNTTAVSTTGVQTTTQMDYCRLSPCLNNGTCRLQDHDPFYNCTCKPSYQGPKCEDRKFFQNGSCEYFIEFGNMSRSSANLTCQGLNGTLAMIKTEGVQKFLEAKISSLYGNTGKISFWIGGSKRGNQWSWDDFTSFGGYSNWDPAGNNTVGNGLIITSPYSVGPPSSNLWTSLLWLNMDEASAKSGLICEIAKGNICGTAYCSNGGECIEIGCQRICRCQPGFTGTTCTTDNLIMKPQQASYTVEAGVDVSVTLNITSIDGPVRIVVTDASQQAKSPRYKRNALGEVTINLGKAWITGVTTRYNFTASPENNIVQYSRHIFIDVIVKLPKMPEASTITTKVCGTTATVSFSPSNLALQMTHRVEIVKHIDSKVVSSQYFTPSTVRSYERIFTNLPKETDYNIKIFVCTSRCLRSNNKTYQRISVKTEAPIQQVQYLLATKKYKEKICQLRWSTEDFPVLEFRITQMDNSDSSTIQNRRNSNVTLIEGSMRSHEFKMNGRTNYSFKISARTCNGLSPELNSIGVCVIEDFPHVNAETSSATSSAAAIALGILFGLSVMVIIAMIAFWLWINHDGIKTPGETEEAPKNYESSKPYYITFFGNSKREKPTSTTYENCTTDAYEVPMTHPTYMENQEKEDTSSPGDIYQYENFTAEQQGNGWSEISVETAKPDERYTPSPNTPGQTLHNGHNRTTQDASAKVAKVLMPPGYKKTNPTLLQGPVVAQTAKATGQRYVGHKPVVAKKPKFGNGVKKEKPQAHNEVAAALARLKPVGAKK